jgi:hypothetical protein
MKLGSLFIRTVFGVAADFAAAPAHRATSGRSFAHRTSSPCGGDRGIASGRRGVCDSSRIGHGRVKFRGMKCADLSPVWCFSVFSQVLR